MSVFLINPLGLLASVPNVHPRERFRLTSPVPTRPRNVQLQALRPR